jgi:hypothetical protein
MSEQNVVEHSRVVKETLERKLRYYFSSCFKRNDQVVASVSDTLRNTLRSVELPSFKETRNHSHGKAASIRSQTADWMFDLVRHAGLKACSYQGSNSDIRKGVPMTRDFRFPKDLSVEPTDITPLKWADVILLVDVDYYLDMPAFLATYPNKSLLLYTLTPEEVACDGVDNTTFTIDANSEVTCTVSGGARYKHKIWDYGADNLCITKTFCGITTSICTYLVERVSVAKHRSVILLTPTSYVTGFAALTATCMLDEGHALVRMNYTVQYCCLDDNKTKTVFLALQTYDCKDKDDGGAGNMTSVGLPGQLAHATVDSTTIESLCQVAMMGAKYSLSSNSIQTYFPKPTSDEEKVMNKIKGNTLALFVKHKVSGGISPAYVPVGLGVRSYNYDIKRLTDAKPSLVAYMQPLIHNSFSPDRNAASERRAIAGRISAFQRPDENGSVRRSVPHDSMIWRWFLDFVDELFLWDADFRLLPWTNEEVETHFMTGNSSSARRSVERLNQSGPFVEHRTRNFIKAESYSGVKDPRIITEMDDKHKVRWAAYTLALSTWCKQFTWYGPGKKPKEIAARVVEVATGADYVNQSDFHRMDGTISTFFRAMEPALYRRAFPKIYHNEIGKLYRKTFDAKGTFPEGTFVEQGTAQCSGNVDTSFIQTIRTAFTAYCGFRHTVNPQGTGRHYNSAEAFQSLGAHFGDDGVDANLPIASYKWAADKLGLVLEASIVEWGDRGLNFLSRVYSPEVWSGCVDSMCDLKRQLSKFHTTGRLPESITPAQKLVEKSRGFFLTDRNTPIIGDFVTAVDKVSNLGDVSDQLGVNSWWSRYEECDQWPNAYGDWMADEFKRSIPEFNEDDFSRWLCFCVDTGLLESFLESPLFHPIEEARSEHPVIVDDELLEPEATPDIIPPPVPTGEQSFLLTPSEAPKESKKAKIKTCDQSRRRTGERRPRLADRGRRAPMLFSVLE